MHLLVDSIIAKLQKDKPTDYGIYFGFYNTINGVGIPCVGFGTWKTPEGPVAVGSVAETLRLGYRHIDMAAFEKTLKTLQLDYLDLYLIHWPAVQKQYENWEEINLST